MARFAVANLEDQSAPVWIVTLLSLSYTTMTSLMRGFIKLSMLGIDDGGASLAQLFTYGNIFSVIYALRHGLARSGHRDGDDNEEPDYREVSEECKSATTLHTSTDMGRHYKQASSCIFWRWLRQK